MKDILLQVNSPLFDGVNPEDRKTMLGCIGYHIGTFKKLTTWEHSWITEPPPTDCERHITLLSLQSPAVSSMVRQ